MRSLYESIYTISAELNKISIEGIPSEIKNLKYTGDNANFAISIFQENLINPSVHIKNFLSNLGEEVFKWANQNLHNGYEKMADVHHGTELFIGFLPRYIDSFPQDERPKSLILGAADYIGNWKKGDVQWYDYNNETFKSWNLGSLGFDERKIFLYETADHIRFIHIALNAWKISEDVKYFDWALAYGKKFAKKIINSKKIIPVAWGLDGKGFYPEDMETPSEKFLAANHHHIVGDPLSGVENLIASGSIYAFGDLYNLSKENIFKQCAKKIIIELLGCINNPYADPAAAAISYYRNTFADHFFDKKIIKTLENIPLYNEAELLLIVPEIKKIRQPGIGNRKDMLYWQTFDKDGRCCFLNEPPTSFFTLAYQITGNIEYADRALKMAARKLRIARSVLRSGYEHADMGGAVCSIASGHGRNWGIGSITGCYAPLILGSTESLGSLKTIIQFKLPNISKKCISIIRRIDHDTSELNLFNFSENNIKIDMTIIKSKKNTVLNIKAGSHLTYKIKNS